MNPKIEEENSDIYKLLKVILALHVGHRLIIGIDGLSRSGKTTFVEHLRNRLNETEKNVYIFHIDNHIVERKKRYHTGREEWYEYYSLQWDIEYLRENLFEKIRNNDEIKLAFYQDESDKQITNKVLIPNDCVVIIEGVFLQRIEWREFFDYVVYLDCPRETRFLREGESTRSHIEKFKTRYWKAEDHYLDAICPLVNADMIIRS